MDKDFLEMDLAIVVFVLVNNNGEAKPELSSNFFLCRYAVVLLRFLHELLEVLGLFAFDIKRVLEPALFDKPV